MPVDVAVIEPVEPALHNALFTTPVTVLMFTVTTWSAAPASTHASPPMMRRMNVFTVTTPTCEPNRFWLVAPRILVQLRLSVLICHWKVAADPKEGYALAELFLTMVGRT